MIPPLTHGCIMGGIVTTPDLEAALGDYETRLGLMCVERGPLAADLAASWGCPESAGRAMATLQPTSGAHCFLRLVEQPIPESFKPTTTFGWASYELTVQQVMSWPERLEGSGFDIIGMPQHIPEIPFFIAMQMLGRGREMIYLNETLMSMPNTDLPPAHSHCDHMFIVILATPDREATVAWYRDRLQLDAADTFTLEYRMINQAFGLPAGTTSQLTMMQKGRLPIIEVDDYPPQATPRASLPGCLPPGNALVTLGVESLDALDVDFISPPATRHDAIYAGMRSATIVGSAGELIEIIEIGNK
jgi:catechol 2,3-dioxygenase-like lactoylglutathione lyase family enzyme